MSLINEALRKTQRDRSPDRMPSSEGAAGNNFGGSGQTPPTGGGGMRPNLIVGLIVLVALLIGLVTGLSIVFLSSASQTQVASETDSAAEKPADLAPLESTARVTSSAPVDPQIVPPAQSDGRLASPGGPSVVEELRRAREAAEAKIAAEERAAAEAAARATAEPNDAIIEWLSQATISGVRLSGSDSRIILNGETYAVGEYVSHPLRLRLMVVQASRVLFVDENGKRYTKRL